MKKHGTTTTKIIAATSMVIFSLLVSMTGVYAWFTSAHRYSNASDGFAVDSIDDCEIENIYLYRFVYGKNALNEYDYLKPEDGDVYKCDFVNHHFQYMDNSTPVIVEDMNMYDPVELIINKDKKLKDLNCNAVYEINFHSDSYKSMTVNVTAKAELIPVDESLLVDEAIPGSFKILKKLILSDYVDFDVFKVSDITTASNFIVADDDETLLVNEYDNRPHYPSYKLSTNGKNYMWDETNGVWDDEGDIENGTDKGTLNYYDYLPSTPDDGDYYKVLKNTPSALSVNEDIYYKISYLASLKLSHSNFYSTSKSEPLDIATTPIVFDASGNAKMYLNVNYSPSTLERYSKDIYTTEYKAIYDYKYVFSFTK